MKALFLALALTCALSGAALAGGCDEDLKKLDTALQSPALTPEVKAQAQDMRNQAQKLCEAGNVEEGADVLSEAMALVGGGQ